MQFTSVVLFLPFTLPILARPSSLAQRSDWTWAVSNLSILDTSEPNLASYVSFDILFQVPPTVSTKCSRHLPIGAGPVVDPNL
jgi:hypothetical protein